MKLFSCYSRCSRWLLKSKTSENRAVVPDNDFFCAFESTSSYLLRPIAFTLITNLLIKLYGIEGVVEDTMERAEDKL